ncbi:MAG: DUF5678 domain-containing protein [Candidatus Thermoplasmatota archaeon]|nr:DUF5678 domain-containing protein [Candidatus Thermoplasmatota archaeon]
MEEEMQVLEDYEKDNRWISENYEQIKKEYTEKYIAVKDKNIIDANKNSDKLIKRLRERNEELERIVIEFIPSEDFILVL